MTHHPAIRPYIKTNPKGQSTINFHDPAAVKCLNQALLFAHYDLTYWDIPTAYLCPAVPGRADYIHHLADLLETDTGKKIPRGSKVRCLDIGIGANCIYPIIGSHDYGWSFVGTDIDTTALKAAQKIVQHNTRLYNKVELRQQANKEKILEGIVNADEHFDLVLCNPPFYASAKEASIATQRKRKGLGATGEAKRNFSGKANELWYPGGELAFIRKLMSESAQAPTSCYWYTTLVAKGAHLDTLKELLHQHRAAAVKIIPMTQGQKQSRILAWTFLKDKQRKAWETYRNNK